ncbi:peroxidase family protein [Thiothrix eikelboomii]|uniref:peroxidase family protein n=1 Tax=Thiothrix eikelboomii TaxID=92487 RepID=UPI003BAE374C
MRNLINHRPTQPSSNHFKNAAGLDTPLTNSFAVQNLTGVDSFANSFRGGNGNHPIFNILLNFLIELLKQLLEQINQQQPQEYRSADGSGNNLQNPDWGKQNTSLSRLAPKDSSREPGGSTEVNLPSTREVSNAVAAQTESTANRKGLSDIFWMWGQFLDHDMSLVHANTGVGMGIPVPAGDPYFDPQGTGTATIPVTRSNSVVDANGIAQQTNSITAYLDGSNVYGSDQATADALRSFAGGKLKTSEGNLLPKDANGAFIAGDERSNENPALTSMHTIWMREHNRIADELAANHPSWSDEKLYQEARRTVVAEIQAITYNEFLPNLLGEDALATYQGYDPTQNAAINNEFAAAAFRFGHTMLSPTLLRLDENGNELAEGNVALRDAFGKPSLVTESGIEPFLRGGMSQTAQAFDPMVIDDVRNFLFGQPGAGGLDLVAINLQRGRDHGLAGYNDVRESLGLSRIESFDDPIWQGDFGQKLAQVYDSPDEVDLWVGGLAEKYTGDSLAGETLTTILTQQFEALRDGDRFWYENQFSGQQLQDLNKLTLAEVIQRNTTIQNVQDHAFLASNLHLQAQTTGQAATTAAEPMMATAKGAAPATTAVEPVTTPDPEQIRLLQDALAKGLLG